MYASMLNAHRHGFHNKQYWDKVYFDASQFEFYNRKLEKYFAEVDEFIEKYSVSAFRLSYDDLFQKEKLIQLASFLLKKNVDHLDYNCLGLERQWTGDKNYLDRFMNPDDVARYLESSNFKI